MQIDLTSLHQAQGSGLGESIHSPGRREESDSPLLMCVHGKMGCADGGEGPSPPRWGRGIWLGGVGDREGEFGESGRGPDVVSGGAVYVLVGGGLPSTPEAFSSSFA